MCPGSLARLVPEQRTYSYYLQYSADRNTGFVPLEYQHSIYVQYTHALIKALLYIVLPFESAERTVFLCHICPIIGIVQMWRVEDHELERAVGIWHCSEISDHIRMDFQLAAVT